METRQQRLIRQALERGSDAKRQSGADSEADAGSQWRAPEDTLLREKSLRRADPDYVPRTLTAHEWEDYYREHGIPAEHRSPQQRGRSQTPADSVDPGESTGHRRD